ncbi:MAG: HAD-IA family hydrolase [Myxococcota bacterium]|nr:HAD-IA family hydrolase [Myxococcota bacterium]
MTALPTIGWVCLSGATNFQYTDRMVVVFDLDGTLIDSTRALLTAHEIAWASVGHARPPVEAILDLVGLPLLDTMRTLAPHLDPGPLAEAYVRAYSVAADQNETLYDGIEALLTQPFRAAVATGKSQRGAERAVARHGLSGRFELVLGGDAVPRPKPFPDMLFKIMAETVCRDLVMVGDTTYDLEMARAAGVNAIGVAWGHHEVSRLEQWAPVVHTVEGLHHALSAFITPMHR